MSFAIEELSLKTVTTLLGALASSLILLRFSVNRSGVKAYWIGKPLRQVVLILPLSGLTTTVLPDYSAKKIGIAHENDSRRENH